MAEDLDLDDVRARVEERGEKADVPVDDLRVDGENPNEMSDGNFDLLVKRIRERGWVGGPIIANTGDLPGYDGPADGGPADPEGLIADGEHRWRAARELGLDDVPVLLIDFADDAERRLWRQEMNKNRGEHDPGADAKEVHEILGSDSEDDLMDLIEAQGQSLGDVLDDGGMGDGDPEIDTPDGEIQGPDAQHDFLVVTLEVPVDAWDDAQAELEDLADRFDADLEVA